MSVIKNKKSMIADKVYSISDHIYISILNLYGERKKIKEITSFIPFIVLSNQNNIVDKEEMYKVSLYKMKQADTHCSMELYDVFDVSETFLRQLNIPTLPTLGNNIGLTLGTLI